MSNEPTGPLGDVFDTWTDAEREVWGAWSQVEQDLSRPAATHACSHVLDALETSAHQVTRLQALAVSSACASLHANPLLPTPASALVERTCRPLAGWSDWQQHLISAWFGLARQLAISLRPTGTDQPGLT